MEPRYTEDNIKSLEWYEHIRVRPGMYIGKLGDGSTQEDGIYVLFKEIIDNSMDEYFMGYGKKIDITLRDNTVVVRDYGRGIPLGKLVDCVSKINTGGKFDSEAFKKSVGLNGVGTKAVNALSSLFRVQAIRDGQTKTAEFKAGNLLHESPLTPTTEPNGTIVTFQPDDTIFRGYRFQLPYIEEQLRNYAYLNSGLKIYLNGQLFHSKRGLFDLLTERTDPDTVRYPIIHIQEGDIEVALTHGSQYGEQIYSFVNGQNTTQGGTHVQAFREGLVKTVREFYNKQFEAVDIRASVIAAVSVRVQEPVFESQTKTKLGSVTMSPDGVSIRSYVADFLKRHLDDYLHKQPDTARELLKRIQQSERERKEIAGIKKLANERAKKAAVHNKKLRDCRVHFTDVKHPLHRQTTLFITEGDSASGSITKARQVDTEAVFSLRGKPLNCFNLTKKIVYENEEFNLLQHALNIEESIDHLRYNRVVIATDADVDGMHIRLLLLTFFLQFFPDLVKNNHLYILQTPLFRVRNRRETVYCYDEAEKQQALLRLGDKAEITRFKGLGEISPDEFAAFIGESIRLEPVRINKHTHIEQLLSYYMGKNTPERQSFIIERLRTDLDRIVAPESVPETMPPAELLEASAG